MLKLLDLKLHLVVCSLQVLDELVLCLHDYDLLIKFIFQLVASLPLKLYAFKFLSVCRWCLLVLQSSRLQICHLLLRSRNHGFS